MSSTDLSCQIKTKKVKYLYFTNVNYEKIKKQFKKKIKRIKKRENKINNLKNLFPIFSRINRIMELRIYLSTF